MLPFDVLRLVHGGLATVSGTFFLTRGVWMLLDSALLKVSFVRVAPHIVDTFLLLFGVALAVWSRQFPFVDAWLTAKLLALILYIGLGLVALRLARTRLVRSAAFLGALLCFSYMLAVAYTRNVLPWR